MAANTRGKLLAALRRLSENTPPERLSYADLAREAGVTEPTARRHLGARDNFAALLAQATDSCAPQDTRERILSAAAQVFAAQGYAATSIDEIAKHSGLTKGAVYWHFSSKAELFYTLLEERCQRDVGDALRQVAQDGRVALPEVQHIIEGVVRRFQQDPEWPRLFMEFVLQTRDPAIAQRIAALYADLYQQVARVQRELQASGSSHAGIAADDAARFWVAMIDGLTLAWLINPELDLLQTARQFTQIAWVGLGPHFPE